MTINDKCKNYRKFNIKKLYLLKIKILGVPTSFFNNIFNFVKI